MQQSNNTPKILKIPLEYKGPVSYMDKLHDACPNGFFRREIASGKAKNEKVENEYVTSLSSQSLPSPQFWLSKITHEYYTQLKWTSSSRIPTAE